MNYKNYNQEIVRWCMDHKGEKFHALFCDPPYGIEYMGKKWDNNGNIVFDPRLWRMLKEYMYDGAFGMAFSSARTWHRLAVAIEDAGFILHNSLFLWGFASGFPKAARVNTGEFQETGETESLSDIRSGSMHSGRDTDKVYKRPVKIDIGIQKVWAGHRYGLQSIKPAAEPIIVFQKPCSDNSIQSIITTGAGALDIDGSRVGGKWPSNLIIVHTADCIITESGWRCDDDCPARAIKTQAGDESHYFNADWSFNIQEQIDLADALMYSPKVSTSERNAGLDNFTDKVRNRVNGGGLENEPRFAPVISKNTHPTMKPLKLTKYLAGLLLPPESYERKILVPFSGVGSEMIGAMLAGWDNIVGVEKDIQEGYVSIANARMEYWRDPIRQSGKVPPKSQNQQAASLFDMLE